MPEARRLIGPHLLDDRTGAALDVPLAADTDALIPLWEAEARRLLDALGWQREHTSTHQFTGGACLFVSAPVDVLYAATDLAEMAFQAAEARHRGDTPDPDAEARLMALVREERRPHVRMLARAAEEHGVTFLHDAGGVSVGTGRGAVFIPHDAIPEPGDVEWGSVYDVPLVLVTGSNGKTTSVRLIAAMAEAAGLLTGSATTDGVVIGGTMISADDFSGPMGARQVLRHAAVECAVLETARGGILRRGLAVRHADAALVTNIAEDHFGDWGVNSLEDLADVKLVIARVVREGGATCLNADDAELVRRAETLGERASWFSLDPATPLLATGPGAAWLDDHTLMLRQGDRRGAVMDARNIPLTLRGAARYNVANTLGAVLTAAALRKPDRTPLIPLSAIRAALEGFESSLERNPGRGNLIDVGGVHVLVDYAHNPHGMAALTQMISVLPARRRLIVLGQAGDRTDDALRALAQSAWALEPDRIILKEMGKYRRGRAEGEVCHVLEAELQALGAPMSMIERVETEAEATRTALAWAQEGDLLILLVHEKREEVLRVLEEAGRREAGKTGS
jgi:UDP-N-acetylmuramyl tripeptide synthase